MSSEKQSVWLIFMPLWGIFSFLVTVWIIYAVWSWVVQARQEIRETHQMVKELHQSKGR